MPWLFSLRGRLVKEIVFGCDYGYLVYSGLPWWAVRREYYGKGMLKVSESDFCKWAKQLGLQITVDGIRHAV